jgi:hypothetical protein
MHRGCRDLNRAAASVHPCALAALPISPTDQHRKDATAPRRNASGRVRGVSLIGEIGRKTLAAAGRGPDEASRLLFFGCRGGLGLRCRCTHGNHDHRGCNRRGRRRRMHHHAQRAMVGVVLRGVQVRHLHYRQESCQNQANHRGHSPRTRLRPLAAALPCLEPCLRPCLDRFPDRHANILCFQHTQIRRTQVLTPSSLSGLSLNCHFRPSRGQHPPVWLV